MKVPSKEPGKLAIRASGSPLFLGGKASYNYAIGGMPFLSAAANLDYGKRKIRRATAPFRKQQFDNQASPGEQSLDGYWLRSQQSFHGGAGLLYSDPSPENPQADIRFLSSKNIDCWTKGRISLLSATTSSTPTGILELTSIILTDGTAAIAGINLNNAFTKTVSAAPTVTALASTAWSITNDGTSVFVSCTDGLYKAAITGTGVGAFSKIYTYAVTRSSKVAWVKERLILSVDEKLYECTPNPAGPPAALPTAFYTAQNPSWNFTSITETSGAFYVAGSGVADGSVLGFTIDDVGGTPTLSSGVAALTLPGGEIPYAVFGYLGNRMAIGTNKGARMATTGTGIELRYGPLIFETVSPVLDFAGRDRFIWAGYSESVEQDIRLARIDLSLEIEELRFAWATDLVGVEDTDNTVSIAFYGGSDVVAFSTSDNLWTEDEVHRAETGYLDTSRIRYSTLEPKAFRSIRVRGPQLTGTLGISIIDENGTVTPVNSYGVGQTPGADDLTLPGPSHRDFLSFRFTLNASSDELTGAILHGWQVKALPASPRQRMITLPLWCFDFEKDRHGQRVGGHGSAKDRLLALEDLEAQGGIVQFQDLDIDQAVDVFIESMEYEQADPPPHFKGWGGIIFIQMRTV